MPENIISSDQIDQWLTALTDAGIVIVESEESISEPTATAKEKANPRPRARPLLM